MDKRVILFIDDDPTVAVIGTTVLISKGFKVFSASGAAQARDIVAREKIDVIICDVMMPDEDGLTFCEKLRAAGNQTPLMFLSAVGQADAMRKGISVGAQDYLVKPFDIGELVNRVNALMKVKPSRPVPPPPPKAKPSGFRGWLTGG